MFNPWDHLYTAPLGNIDGGPLSGEPREPTVTFWTQQTVPSAVPGQWDTVTHWLWDASDGLLHQITEDQAFVQQLWRHAKFGLPAPLPETPDTTWGQLGFTNLDYRITPDEMRAAVLDLPHVLADIQATGYSEADVWAYTQAEAPWAVGLVGIA